MLEHLISCNKLEESARTKLRDTLLRRHRHQRPQGIRKGLSNIIGKGRPSSNQSSSSASNARKSSTMSLPTSDKSKDNGVYATFPSGKKIDADRVLPYQVICWQSDVPTVWFFLSVGNHAICYILHCCMLQFVLTSQYLLLIALQCL